MKIKHILISIFILFALLPALSIAMLSAIYFKDHVQDGIIATLVAATDIESAHIQSYFDLLHQHMDPMNSIPLLPQFLLERGKGLEVGNGELKTFISKYLNARSKGRPDVLVMTIMNTQGKILASSNEALQGTLSDHLPAPYIFAHKPFLIKPILDPLDTPHKPSSRQSCFSFTMPLIQAEQTLGYVYIEYTTDYFEKSIASINTIQSGRMFLLEPKGKIIAATDTLVTGKNIVEDPTLKNFSRAFFEENFTENTKGIIRYTLEDVPRVAYFTVVPETGWILLSAMDNKKFSAFLRGFEKSMITLCIVLFIIASISSLLVSNSLLLPIDSFIDTINRIKKGDRNARFRYRKKNELGMIAAAFNGLVRLTNKRTAKLLALTKRLTKNQQQLETITHNIPGGLFRCNYDREAEFSFISDGFLDILGFDRQGFKERCKNSLSHTIHPDDRETVLNSMMTQLETKNSFELEYRAMMGFGSQCWILVKGELKSQSNNGKMWIDGIATDISEQVHSQQYLNQTLTDLRETLRELKISEERLRLIIDHSSDIIFEWSAAQRYIYLSPSFKKRFGYMPLLPNGFSSLLQFKEIHPQDARSFRTWVRQLSKGMQHTQEDFRIRTSDGRYLWTRHQMTIIRDQEGTITRAVGLLIDVNDAKCAEQKLLNKAERDNLSGLYNRGTFEEKAIALLKSSQEANNPLAFMFLDIDNFRNYNTLYGHAFGDRVISFIGSVLADCTKLVGFAGRRGGDEFVVCCEQGTSVPKLKKLAEHIQEELAAGITSRGNVQVPVQCSIGIVQVFNNDTSLEALIHAADTAMYKVKNAGKGSYHILRV